MRSVKKKPILGRIMEKVEFIPICGCWVFTGGLTKYDGNGYGVIKSETNKKVLAHRAIWEIHNGVIPKDLKVLHFCDTPTCVNPDHLFLGTQMDNIIDMFSKGRNGTSIKDIKGEKIGKWMVEGVSDFRGKSSLYWDCVCDCGVRKPVSASSLHKGESKSCGCGRKPTYGRAKISFEDARKIISDNRPYREIAKEYPITVSQISNIKKGLSWAVGDAV